MLQLTDDEIAGIVKIMQPNGCTNNDIFLIGGKEFLCQHEGSAISMWFGEPKDTGVDEDYITIFKMLGTLFNVLHNCHGMIPDLITPNKMHGEGEYMASELAICSCSDGRKCPGWKST